MISSQASTRKPPTPATRLAMVDSPHIVVMEVVQSLAPGRNRIKVRLKPNPEMAPTNPHADNIAVAVPTCWEEKRLALIVQNNSPNPAVLTAVAIKKAAL